MSKPTDIEKVDLTEQIAGLNAEAERLRRRLDELGEAGPPEDAEKASESVMESVAELRKIAKRHRDVA
jgi:hypothetical protein